MYQEFGNFSFPKRFIFLSYIAVTEYLGLVSNPLTYSFHWERSKTHGVVGLLIPVRRNGGLMLQLFPHPKKYPWKLLTMGRDTHEPDSLVQWIGV